MRQQGPGREPGWEPGAAVPWEELSDRARAQAVGAVRYLPTVLADVGTPREAAAMEAATELDGCA